MHMGEIGFCLVLRLNGMQLVGIWRQVGSIVLLVNKPCFDALLLHFHGGSRCFWHSFFGNGGFETRFC